MTETKTKNVALRVETYDRLNDWAKANGWKLNKAVEIALTRAVTCSCKIAGTTDGNAVHFNT